MRNKFEFQDYEPVTPSRTSRRRGLGESEDAALQIRALEPSVLTRRVESLAHSPAQEQKVHQSHQQAPAINSTNSWVMKRGHSLTYLGLFIFTFLVFFRPYELMPSLSWLSRGALITALITLAVFIPTQLGLENRLTVRPREIKLAFALLVAGLLSIPLALEPLRAFQSLIEFLKVILMFVVMVNVVRTEKRLRGLILLVLLASCVLSLAALNDYAHGNLVLQGRRIAGLIGGLFSNPNDLALHLVTMIPISLTLFLGSRGAFRKLSYLACSLLLTLGMVATFSRGGFLGLVCVIGFLSWKLARRNRVVIGIAVLIVLASAVALAPSAYRSRISTTSDDSATARTDDLKRSLLVAARHPFFGVGMDNYILYSNMNKATHNAYTQVAAEMGFAAFLLYFWFLVSPFSSLRKIDHATGIEKRKPPVYYLAIGLQASLVGYMVVSFFASVAYLWYVYYLVAYGICLRQIYANIASLDTSAVNLSHRPTEIETKTQPSPGRIDRAVVLGGNR